MEIKNEDSDQVWDTGAQKTEMEKLLEEFEDPDEKLLGRKDLWNAADQLHSQLAVPKKQKKVVKDRKDLVFSKIQNATNPADLQRAMNEMEKYI